MTEKIKCPKCGEIEQVEITKTWGDYQSLGTYTTSDGDLHRIPKIPVKNEIYCNTCGQISIVEGTSSHIS